MQNRIARPVLVVALAAVALGFGAGCRFGEARFESTIKDRSFDPAGTVFSYADAQDDAFNVDKNPRVAVAMTWIIFDPNGDLNDLDGSALADYSHELKLRDAFSLVFDQQSDMKAGAAFKSVVEGGEELGDGRLRTHLHLEPERISGQSTYGDIEPFASKRTTDVTITSVDFASATQVVAADVTVTFERTGTDPAKAREGTFTGSFTAPVVGERAAEQNLALLDVVDVLGLPLPPRGTP
jgi:hypothetical protein